MDAVGLLDRAPRWFRAAALATAQGRGPLGALLDRLRHPYDDAGIPDLPGESDAPVRMLIGPANEVEQGYQWARAVRTNLPGVDAVAMMGFDPGGYAVRADLRVPEGVYLRSPEWHDRFRAFLLTRTHVVIESGSPLLGRELRSDAYAEIDMLRAGGVNVAVMFHGSDIRPPRQHAADSEWSPFRDPDLPSAVLADRARRNADGVRRTGVPVFVSTPDLLRYVPGAVWCPVVIDPDDWIAVSPRPDAGPMRVVHAPSSTRIKGTERLEPVVRALEAEGVVAYRRVAGIPYAEMPAVYAAADVVLDQFLIGGYGVAALEAMAAGALVVGHVDEGTRAVVRERTGLEVPIAEATIGTLDRVLRDIARDPGAYAELRSAGPAFVRAVHDGRRSAEAMASFLGVTG